MKRLAMDERPYDDLTKNIETNPMNLVPSDLLHLIPGFLERREREATELRNLLARNEFDGMKAIGHKLKGTGLGYGFPVVSEIGRELEIAATNKDDEHIRDLVTQLEDFSTNLKTFLTLKTRN